MNNILDRFRLDGCVALVTGAAGYLGKDISLALSSAGASVILNGRNDSSLQHLADQIERISGRAALVVPADLCSAESTTLLAKEACSWKGRIDIIVHCAYSSPASSEAGFTSEAFEKDQRLVCGAFYQLTQECRLFLEQSGQTRPGGASVIALSSMYGMVSPDPGIYALPGDINPPHYGAAKAGLLQLVRWMSCNLAGDGIRVNSISPGAFPEPKEGMEFMDFQKRLCEKIPLHRTGKPEDLAGAVLFLASDASSYITGSNLVADGGWTAW